VIVRDVGDGVREKSGAGGAFTTRVTDVVRVSDPLIPVIVKGKLPAGVVVPLFVVTVIVDVPPLATLVGLKLALAPAGRPLALKLATLPENPFTPSTVTLYVVLLPAVTVREVGDGLREKSGDGGGGVPDEGRTVMYVFEASINPAVSFTVVQR
jgi:hypothetical protein